MVMKARRIRIVELLDAPLEISLLLSSILAQKNLLQMGFSNRGVWSQMAAKDPFSNSNYVLLQVLGMWALVHAPWRLHGLCLEPCSHYAAAWPLLGAMQSPCSRMVAACPSQESCVGCMVAAWPNQEVV